VVTQFDAAYNRGIQAYDTSVSLEKEWRAIGAASWVMVSAGFVDDRTISDRGLKVYNYLGGRPV
jgi:hypothetical protein